MRAPTLCACHRAPITCVRCNILTYKARKQGALLQNLRTNISSTNDNEDFACCLLDSALYHVQTWEKEVRIATNFLFCLLSQFRRTHMTIFYAWHLSEQKPSSCNIHHWVAGRWRQQYLVIHWLRWWSLNDICQRFA